MAHLRKSVARRIIYALAVMAAMLVSGAFLSYDIAGAAVVSTIFGAHPPEGLYGFLLTLTFYVAITAFVTVLAQYETKAALAVCSVVLPLVAFGVPWLMNLLQGPDDGSRRDRTAPIAVDRVDTVMRSSTSFGLVKCSGSPCVALLLSGAARTVVIGTIKDAAYPWIVTDITAWRRRPDPACRTMLDDVYVFGQYMTFEENSKAGEAGADSEESSRRANWCVIPAIIPGKPANILEVSVDRARGRAIDDLPRTFQTQVFARAGGRWQLLEQSTQDLGGGSAVAYPLAISGPWPHFGIRTVSRKIEMAGPKLEVLDTLIRNARKSAQSKPTV